MREINKQAIENVIESLVNDGQEMNIGGSIERIYPNEDKAREMVARGDFSDWVEDEEDYLLSKSMRIGQEVVSDVGLGNSWVSYSNGNDDEDNHYRDVWVDGELAYCDGEVCEIVGISDSGDVIDLENRSESLVFSIGYKQFKKDFKIVIDN